MMHDLCRRISKAQRSDAGDRGVVDGMYCLDHEVDTCRCGAEWGEHEGGISDPKEECVACGKKIDPKFYHEKGNYCATCNGQYDKKVKAKQKRRYEIDIPKQ